MTGLRVLHVGKFYPPFMGGIETHLQALCNQLSRTIDVRVIVANHKRGSTEETIEGVRVSRMTTPATLFSNPLCPSMPLRIRQADADLVHIHLPNPAAISAYLTSGCRGRLVFSYHSDTIRSGTHLTQKCHGGRQRCVRCEAISTLW